VAELADLPIRASCLRNSLALTHHRSSEAVYGLPSQRRATNVRVSPDNGGPRCTLTLVPKTGDPTREVNTEIVAVHLFGRALDAGAAITRRWVDEQLEGLRAHPPECRCSAPCSLTRSVTASQVRYTAVSWQRQYRRAQVLARR